MELQTLCEASYKHGNLTYIVKVNKGQEDVDWETNIKSPGEKYFVEYVETTLPSKNRVGGFNSLNEALEWAHSQFGPVQWLFLD